MPFLREQERQLDILSLVESRYKVLKDEAEKPKDVASMAPAMRDALLGRFGIRTETVERDG